MKNNLFILSILTLMTCVNKVYGLKVLEGSRENHSDLTTVKHTDDTIMREHQGLKWLPT
ncbi:hypothetical protein N9N03_02000 [Chlamydiia bacterium]|jgi:hypothetical protein|nr:hypothetical protein [Chlamydiia bacterium]